MCQLDHRSVQIRILRILVSFTFMKQLGGEHVFLNLIPESSSAPNYDYARLL